MEAPTIAQLSAEDLTRWRMVNAKLKSAEIKSEAYSREEIEQAFMQSFLLWGEFMRAYDLPDEKDLAISVHTGRCFVEP